MITFFLCVGSSSRAVVAAVAYQPRFAGDASPAPEGGWRSTSRPIVVGAAYQPAFAGGASRSPFGAGARVPHLAVDGVELALLALDDIAERRHELVGSLFVGCRRLVGKGDVASRGRLVEERSS